jgi:hypothetical protein
MDTSIVTALRPFRILFLLTGGVPESQPLERAHRLALWRCYFDLWECAEDFCKDMQPLLADWEAIMLRHEALEAHEMLTRIKHYFSNSPNFRECEEHKRRTQTLVGSGCSCRGLLSVSSK